jgi:hypothetical protein
MLVVMAILVGLTAASAAAAEATDVFLPVDENDVLILEVRAERYLASSGLVGYRYGDQVLLPLGGLAAILEYAVQSFPEQGVAEGWLVDEDHPFRLDVRARSVTVAGRQEGISEPCLYLNDEDLYVTSDVLARWWPIDINVDLRVLSIGIQPREPVPLLSRLSREAKWSQMQGKDRAEVQYPQSEAPYRLSAWPFLDAAVSLDASRSGTYWHGSLLSRGDLARLSVSGLIGYTPSTAQNWTAWLRAGRDDRDGELLGPLGATSFTVGDVTSDGLSLINGAARGRGLTVNNRPLGSVSQFDVIDVTGDVPPGWEVEFYLDGSLQDIQTAGSDGHYFFAAVPLHFGLNTARVVLYGPSGQTREQVHTYNIRAGMWKRGELHYSYSSLQPGKSILGAPTTAPVVEGENVWNHQLDLGYGLSRSTTLNAAVARSLVGDQIRDYAQLRLLQSLGPFFLQAAGVKDLDRGTAASLSAQTQVGRHSIFLGFSDFEEFLGNTPESSGDLVRQSEARLTGALSPWGKPQLNYRLGWLGQDYDVDRDLRRDVFSLNLTGNLGRVNVGHDAGYRVETGRRARNEYLGSFLFAGNIGDLRLRGNLQYDANGGQAVRAASLTASSSFRENLTAQFTGSRTFRGDGVTSLRGNIDWNLRPVRVGLRLGWDTTENTSVGLSVTTSLFRAPDRGNWAASGRQLSGQGAALATAFIDHDGDGVYSLTDEPLAGVGFGRGAPWQDIRTNEDGQAFLPGISPNQLVNVKVDYRTVDDPFLVATFDGLTTVVHPGGVSDLAFPFHYVGEIEGVVARDLALAYPLRNIGLELTDLAGRRIATVVSEFDGIYLFQRVPAGDYLIRVVESTLRGGLFIVPQPQPVTVPPGGDFVQGPPIILRSLGDESPMEIAKITPEQPDLTDAEYGANDELDQFAYATPRLATPAVTGPDPLSPDEVRILRLIYEWLDQPPLAEGDE